MTLFNKLLSLFRKKTPLKTKNMEMTEELVPHYMPSLLYMLEHHEKTKGSDLTKEEVIDICDKAVFMNVNQSDKEKLDSQSGYKDIDPGNCWEEWCAYKDNNPTLKSVNKNSKILLESKSPNCPLAVIVEEYQTCTYMYLIHLKEDGIQSIICSTWIRNHQEAPDDFELAIMQEGFPTMMPKEFSNHPNGKESLQPEDLRCVWFEEGDGVALLEKDSVLGIIPCWANDKVPGYSKDCIKENSFVFPITEENVLLERIKKADEFWNSWDDDPWTPFLNSGLEVLYKEFGEEKKYYAIDNGQWPIKGMARFEKGDMTYLVTIGVSLIPQPFVERVTETPEKLRRIELALAIKTNELMKNEMAICSFLSAQTTIPWNTLAWLGHGHTIECNSIFGKEGEFPFGLFINGNVVASLPQIELKPFRGDDINILWLAPITESEFHIVNATNADAFLNSVQNKKRSWIFGETILGKESEK